MFSNESIVRILFWINFRFWNHWSQYFMDIEFLGNLKKKEIMLLEREEKLTHENWKTWELFLTDSFLWDSFQAEKSLKIRRFGFHPPFDNCHINSQQILCTSSHFKQLRNSLTSRWRYNWYIIWSQNS
jgi:hypothetical protein